MSQNNKSNFNQALWLGIGQLCTYAIAFFTAPILARYFDKLEYGTYKQILYVYASLQSLFIMGLPSVFAYFIPRIKTEQQKALINRLTLYFLLIGLCFSVVLYLCSDWIGQLLNNPELGVGLKLFSPFPLFTLPAIGVEGIYTALKKAKSIAFYHVFTKILMFLCIILPVMVWHTGYREAIMGWGVASFITFLVAMYMKAHPYRGVSSESIPNMDKQVFSYSLPLTGAFIAGFFVNSADQFFISRYYGTEVFADFSNGCFSIPIVGMIAASVKGVLLPVFSKADAEGTIPQATQSYLNAVKNSAILVIPMLLFCMVFASDMVVALFGEKYHSSASFLQWYIVRDFLQVFTYFALLMAFGYSKFYMNMHIVGAIAICAFDFCIVSLSWSPLCIVAISSIFHVSCSVVSFIFLYKKKGVHFIAPDLRKFILRMLVHCIAVLALIFWITSNFSIGSNVFVHLGIACGVYYIILATTGKLVRINYISSFQFLIQSRKK